MECYREELVRIRTILKDNPKGMTVSDISKVICINRNSVAKYLDILLISGHAEMITFGPAKVFFPSRRVPIASIINYVSDCILVVDSKLKIVQINDTFLDIIGDNRDDIIGQSIENASVFSDQDHGNVLGKIKQAIDGKECACELHFPIEKDEDVVFKVRFLPTAFDDGDPGVIIILTDITEKRRIEEALRGRFISSKK